MVTLRITADVPSSRELTLTLPSDVPLGRAELTVTVDSSVQSAATKDEPRTMGR